MADEKKPSNASKRLKGFSVSLGRRLFAALGTPFVHWSVIGLSVMALTWLLYTYIWVPLEQPLVLPGGLTSVNPKVDSASLQIINDERIERSKYTPRSFAAFEPLFRPVATPSPGVR